MGEGVEYLLADSQPPHLFILRKLYRHAHGALTTLAFYYILDGSVYQAPSLQAALLARMVGGCCGYGCGCGCGALRLVAEAGWAGGKVGKSCLSQQVALSYSLPACPSAHLPVCLWLQQRCMFNVKSAFRDMQKDLAPLSQGGLRLACVCWWQELLAFRGAFHCCMSHHSA
jgi:hypothetical protein